MGIGLERIEPGQPQQNGGHERFHRTLKEATSRPPAASVAAQQARFDDFVEQFNHERPHEALGQATPASLWRPSPRRPPTAPITPWYDADHAVRLVRTSGDIKWGGRQIFVSQTLAGETIGVTETRDGRWLVRYAHFDLGLIDPNTHRLRRFVTHAPGNKRSNGPRTLSPMSPVQNVTHLPA
jgi:putative transposase